MVKKKKKIGLNKKEDISNRTLRNVSFPILGTLKCKVKDIIIGDKDKIYISNRQLGYMIFTVTSRVLNLVF